jgi:Fe-S oxidoreductase/nitrate reductase gamma subunit
MHSLIFFSFIVLFVTTVIIVIQEDLHVALFQGNLYLILKGAVNCAGLLAIVGIALALWRRYIIKPMSLDNKRDDLVSLVLLLLILLTGFIVQCLRMAGQPDPWAAFAFVGYAMTPLIQSLFSHETILILHKAFWWIHMVLAMTFIAYLPYGKLSHIILGPAAQFFRQHPEISVPESIDFEDESLEYFGKAYMEDFSWILGFDADACVRCGRCQDNCPAFLSDKHLNPKHALQDLKAHMEAIGNEKRSGSYDKTEPAHIMISNVIPKDDIWACTTCRSCEKQCPFFLGHVDRLTEMRRYLVLTEAHFPSEVQHAFRGLETNGNPFGFGWESRAAHLVGLETPLLADNPNPEILFWPGCLAAFDSRSQRVSTAIVQLLQAAGANLSILGNEEKCCGDPARRLGNEYLFTELAKENIEVLNASRVKRIVTQCPHCLQMLKEEYPAFGGNYGVLHYTQYLHELLDSGRLQLARGAAELVTLHDSCYLGRYQGIFESPRDLLKMTGLTLVEAPRNRNQSLCCGGGGGRMWMEEKEGRKIGEVRAEEIKSLGVSALVTTCPYCLTMLRDGLDALDDSTIESLDIAEVLVSRLIDDDNE